MNGDKPKPRKLRTVRRLIDGDDTFYEEKRGLRTYRLGDKVQPKPNAIAKQMARKAGTILAAAKEGSVVAVLEASQQSLSNDPDAANQALLKWYSKVAARHGILSPEALSAEFLGVIVSIQGATLNMLMREEIVSDEAAIAIEEGLAKHMTQIYALCNAWHWLHMEISGMHELAFSKVQHKAWLAKGAQSTKNKGERRADLVREQIELLRASGTAPEKMASPTFVAKQIKAKTLESFDNAKLPNKQSDSTFEKIVSRVMANCPDKAMRCPDKA
jgi:hypothetical protein